jgi:hypothetical protein
MLPTMNLPAGVHVRDVAARVRSALVEFETMEPTKYALAHWLTGAYRNALVVGNRDHWPFTLRMTSDIESAVPHAQRILAETREASRQLDGRFIERLPPRVHVVRVRSEDGLLGFAPIDVRGAPIVARALSLFLADYLMRPEGYVDDERAA